VNVALTTHIDERDLSAPLPGVYLLALRIVLKARINAEIGETTAWVSEKYAEF
jgi:hypothetical protein